MIDRKLLERYFTGDSCTQKELQEIQEYLEQPDDQLQEFLSDEWRQADGLVNENRRQKNLQRVLMATGQLPVQETPLVSIRRRRWKNYWVAAAIVGVVLLGGISIFNSRNYAPSIAATDKPWKTVQNKSGKVQLVTLPEGSRVWLNSRTVISYPMDYGAGKSREIQLSGEAYFDVVRDAARPFTIYTDSLQTTVLGTSFAIRAWPHTPVIQVALVKGSVRVNGCNGSVQETLIPGDLLTFTNANQAITKTPGGVRSDMYEWTAGKIVLSNTPVIEALEQLEQQYGVTIRCNAAQINNRKLTGKFNREGIDTVLQNILFAADLTFSRKDGIYFITGQ